MAKRELKVLILGDVPEVGDIFERRLFQEALPTHGTHINDRDEFDDELFTDLLAEEIHTQIKRFIEPPKMESPSADQLYRYAQYHNVLEPFFVVARRRYLLYVNEAGRDLIDMLHDCEPQVGAPLEDWVLEATFEEFVQCLDQAFKGHEVVHERCYEKLADRLTALEDEDALRPIEAIERAIGRAADFTHQLQAFSRTSVSQPELVDSNEMLDRLQESLEAILPPNIELVFDLEPDLPAVWADPVHWQFVVTNLVQIGTREMQRSGELQVRTRSVDFLPNQPSLPVGPGRYVVLEFVFEGRALAEWVNERGLDPFFTKPFFTKPSFTKPSFTKPSFTKPSFTKPSFTKQGVDRHAGLELATVKSIVEQGGGRIVADIAAQDADETTSLRVYYPAANEPSSGDSE